MEHIATIYTYNDCRKLSKLIPAHMIHGNQQCKFFVSVVLYELRYDVEGLLNNKAVPRTFGVL